jgi:hypothetical protein
MKDNSSWPVLRLAIVVFFIWILGGFILGLFWAMVVGEHGSIGFLFLGPELGIVGGVLQSGWLLARKSNAPLPLPSSVLLGIVAAAPFLTIFDRRLVLWWVFFLGAGILLSLSGRYVINEDRKFIRNVAV